MGVLMVELNPVALASKRDTQLNAAVEYPRTMIGG